MILRKEVKKKRKKCDNYLYKHRDLRVPPGNHLEKLSGERKGQYSIKINSQYRICFEWSGGDALNVEIVDYHK
jgi:plasmid maintenance system killer protein